MTSEQVMLALVALCLLMSSGCSLHRDPEETPVPRLVSPYGERQVWAVAPLRNESGSAFADGVRVADALARQLEQADGIDVLPVTRVLQAMDALQMPAVASPQDVSRLLRTLGCDAIVVGTVSTWDPYDPPKLGLALELYSDPRRAFAAPLDVRGLSRAPTGDAANLQRAAEQGPASVVSGVWDAADPDTRLWLQRYSIGRSVGNRLADPRLYRISMDLYTEFVSYAASWRLLGAERRRLGGAPPQNEPGQEARREEPLS